MDVPTLTGQKPVSASFLPTQTGQAGPIGRTSRRAFLSGAVAIVLLGCSGGESSTDAVADSSSGVRVISAQDGASIQANPPADLVVLDVRTPEEFADGHLSDATMIDFYRADFRDQLDQLDRDVPYLLYCRSGNRSGQAAAMMKELGFTDVADIDGGILAWDQAGLPTVTG